MTHVLKTWPKPFSAILTFHKRHEVRRADRDFQVGDLLHLREYNPETQQYTGRECSCRVNYITRPGTFGLPADLCVMSIGSPIEHREQKGLLTK